MFNWGFPGFGPSGFFGRTAPSMGDPQDVKQQAEAALAMGMDPMCQQLGVDGPCLVKSLVSKKAYLVITWIICYLI